MYSTSFFSTIAKVLVGNTNDKGAFCTIQEGVVDTWDKYTLRALLSRVGWFAQGQFWYPRCFHRLDSVSGKILPRLASQDAG